MSAIHKNNFITYRIKKVMKIFVLCLMFALVANCAGHHDSLNFTNESSLINEPIPEAIVEIADEEVDMYHQPFLANGSTNTAYPKKSVWIRVDGSWTALAVN